MLMVHLIERALFYTFADNYLKHISVVVSSSENLIYQTESSKAFKLFSL